MSDPRDLGYDPTDLERHPGRDDPPDYRQPFARDYDRLVHATAFRTLQGKTQVVTPGEAEFLRTRLTHTIEVAQLARRLAERVGAHPDCCEAAAILHDFGHPPFGHVGEEALSGAVDAVADEWGVGREAVGGYEGNAQNFRLVTTVLAGSGAFPGLNLTRGTLDAATKYPWERGERAGDKWCFFPTEADEAAWMREPVPAHRRYARSFEAQVMDWADDVAYAVHDVEDWYLAGFIPLGMLTQSVNARQRLVEELIERARRRGKLASPEDTSVRRPTPDDIAETVEALLADDQGPFGPFSNLGGEFDGTIEAQQAMRVMRKRLFELFTRNVSLADPDAPPRRHLNDLLIPRWLRLRNDVMRHMIWIYVIEHPRMATYQRGQRRIVDELYHIHAEAVSGPAANLGVFPRDTQRRLEALQAAADRDGTVETLRMVADHVGALTDAHAARLHRRLTGEVGTAFFEFV